VKQKLKPIAERLRDPKTAEVLAKGSALAVLAYKTSQEVDRILGREKKGLLETVTEKTPLPHMLFEIRRDESGNIREVKLRPGVGHNMAVIERPDGSYEYLFGVTSVEDAIHRAQMMNDERIPVGSRIWMMQGNTFTPVWTKLSEREYLEYLQSKGDVEKLFELAKRKSKQMQKKYEEEEERAKARAIRLYFEGRTDELSVAELKALKQAGFVLPPEADERLRAAESRGTVYAKWTGGFVKKKERESGQAVSLEIPPGADITWSDVEDAIKYFVETGKKTEGEAARFIQSKLRGDKDDISDIKFWARKYRDEIKRGGREKRGGETVYATPSQEKKTVTVVTAGSSSPEDVLEAARKIWEKREEEIKEAAASYLARRYRGQYTFYSAMEAVERELREGNYSKVKEWADKYREMVEKGGVEEATSGTESTTSSPGYDRELDITEEEKEDAVAYLIGQGLSNQEAWDRVNEELEKARQGDEEALERVRHWAELFNADINTAKSYCPSEEEVLGEYPTEGEGGITGALYKKLKERGYEYGDRGLYQTSFVGVGTADKVFDVADEIAEKEGLAAPIEEYKKYGYFYDDDGTKVIAFKSSTGNDYVYVAEEFLDEVYDLLGRNVKYYSYGAGLPLVVSQESGKYAAIIAPRRYGEPPPDMVKY